MITEGKTKVITQLFVGSHIAVAETKDDITAGDGAKHDVMEGKAELATRTTCNVFEFLRDGGIPVAYVGRDGPTTFLTRICEMIPVEVVIRRVATGSYTKRHPNVQDGTVLEEPELEFFLKTTGQRFGEIELPCDDPLMVYDPDNDCWDLHHPALAENSYITTIDQDVNGIDLGLLTKRLKRCGAIAIEAFECLENGWKSLGGTLYDIKFEFGLLPDGSLVLADVVDCDSWRVMWEEIQLSKQPYRDGDDLFKVLRIYRLAASLTDQL